MHPAVFVLSNHLDTLINYNGGKQSPFNCSKMRYEYLSLIIGIANLIRKKTAGCQKERRKKTPNVFPYIYFKVFPVFIKYKTIVSFLTKERKKKKKRQNVFPYIYFKVFPVFQGLSGNSGLFVAMNLEICVRMCFCFLLVQFSFRVTICQRRYVGVTFMFIYRCSLKCFIK